MSQIEILREQGKKLSALIESRKKLATIFRYISLALITIGIAVFGGGVMMLILEEAGVTAAQGFHIPKELWMLVLYIGMALVGIALLFHIFMEGLLDWIKDARAVLRDIVEALC